MVNVRQDQSKVESSHERERASKATDTIFTFGKEKSTAVLFVYLSLGD